MTSPKTEAPEWFAQLIGQCLASLYLLNLEGCPAADSVGKTGRLWARLLWDNPRVKWHMDADSDRIRKAFASMASNIRRWPAPAVFWEHLPDRPAPKTKALIGPDWGRERQPEALACMRRQFADMGFDEFGNRLGEPPSTAKTVANMDQLRALYGDGTDRKSAAAGDR